ncbi:DUF697 domain-containing protein [Lewinella sp. LCG006]|uniref:DUF697 domain-containing protein n=1 Tax=Lewinella sp. LCG006 TaxID=3231911 RepID=UPI0034617312
MRKQIKQFATKKIKESFMSSGKSDRAKHADTVVRNHVIWSMGASFLIPIPIADVFAVSALQLDMIRQLSRVYDVDFAETQGKAIITSLTSSTLARAGARSLIKLVPGIGTLIGGVTVSVFNGASTYALGEVFKRHFDSGGTILDFDTERLKKVYKEKFEKGKKVAKEWQAEAEQTETAEAQPTAQTEPAANVTNPPPATAKNTEETSIMDKLKSLAQMRDEGVITEEEFSEMKRKLIAGM